MEKYSKLVAEHLKARKSKDIVASNLLGVLKGEVDTIIKGSSGVVDSIVEDVAKKMVKGLKIVGGEQSVQEIKILEIYLPETLSESQIKEVLDSIDLSTLPNIGAKMAKAMSIMKGKADGGVIKDILLKYYN